MTSRGEIVVAAGTNGAGKSSIVQPYVERIGLAYFNPDQFARQLVREGVPEGDANGRAWQFGRDRLRDAVDQGTPFAFETTLGGHSIAFELMRALAFGRAVTIFYVGLTSVELHLKRVAARVARGGHDIPEATIRKRYDSSRTNLLAFLRTQAWVRVWDNSAESEDGTPRAPRKVFDAQGHRLAMASPDLGMTPAWAQPLVAQALKLGLSAAA